MSLYADYLREKTDTQVLETEKGFCTYRWLDDGPYIIDIYVLPDFRHDHEATRMANQVAEFGRARGDKVMYGSVNVGTKECGQSLKVLLAYGFEPHSSSTTTPNFWLLSKEI